MRGSGTHSNRVAVAASLFTLHTEKVGIRPGVFTSTYCFDQTCNSCKLHRISTSKPICYNFKTHRSIEDIPFNKSMNRNPQNYDVW